MECPEENTQDYPSLRNTRFLCFSGVPRRGQRGLWQPSRILQPGLLPHEDTCVFCFSGVPRRGQRVLWQLVRVLLPGLFSHETHVSLVSVEFPEEDNEAYGNLPESYCPDYFLMRHMCPFKCALCARKGKAGCSYTSLANVDTWLSI